MGRTACTEPQCLYSRAIPLLPLWAIQPVQNLSACTVELYLYSPYGPYSLYRASVPVRGCTLPFTTFPWTVGMSSETSPVSNITGGSARVPEEFKYWSLMRQISLILLHNLLTASKHRLKSLSGCCCSLLFSIIVFKHLATWCIMSEFQQDCRVLN
jgi:hypothetical protein